MFPYWTLIKYGIPFIIGAMIFGGAAWKIQGVRLDNAKAFVVACESANKENIVTIEQLKKQAESFNKACEARLASKDGTIKKLRDIDALRGKDEKTPTSGDPIRDALNGMWNDNKSPVR